MKKDFQEESELRDKYKKEAFDLAEVVKNLSSDSQDAIKSAEQKIKDLRGERKTLEDEVEFLEGCLTKEKNNL